MPRRSCRPRRRRPRASSAPTAPAAESGEEDGAGAGAGAEPDAKRAKLSEARVRLNYKLDGQPAPCGSVHVPLCWSLACLRADRELQRESDLELEIRKYGFVLQDAPASSRQEAELRVPAATRLKTGLRLAGEDIGQNLERNRMQKKRKMKRREEGRSASRGPGSSSDGDASARDLEAARVAQRPTPDHHEFSFSATSTRYASPASGRDDHDRATPEPQQQQQQQPQQQSLRGPRMRRLAAMLVLPLFPMGLGGAYPGPLQGSEGRAAAFVYSAACAGLTLMIGLLAYASFVFPWDLARPRGWPPVFGPPLASLAFFFVGGSAAFAYAAPGALEVPFAPAAAISVLLLPACVPPLLAWTAAARGRASASVHVAALDGSEEGMVVAGARPPLPLNARGAPPLGLAAAPGSGPGAPEDPGEAAACGAERRPQQQLLQPPAEQLLQPPAAAAVAGGPGSRRRARSAPAPGPPPAVGRLAHVPRGARVAAGVAGGARRLLSRLMIFFSGLLLVVYPLWGYLFLFSLFANSGAAQVAVSVCFSFVSAGMCFGFLRVFRGPLCALLPDNGGQAFVLLYLLHSIRLFRLVQA
eukprot:tig00021438_g21447.t1